jgi:acyl carrier protein
LREDIQAGVFAVIREVLDIDAADLGIETSIPDDLGPNSIEYVTLLLTMEDEFGVTIAEKDIEKTVTIGDLIDHIEKNLGAA